MDKLTRDKLYHIDCMEYMKEMPDNSVDFTLTDIPYDGVNNAREGGGIRVIKKGDADTITFDLDTFLQELYRITKGAIVVFCGNNQVSQVYKYYVDKQDLTVRQLIWEKTNPSPMNGQLIYLSGIENAVWARKRNATFNAFCKNTVFRFPTGSSELHPTEKNHELLADLINDNTNVGDLIFDPCAGSGSTLVVSRQLGRHFIGCELNGEYYQKAKKRLDAEVAQATIFDFLEQ